MRFLNTILLVLILLLLGSTGVLLYLGKLPFPVAQSALDAPPPAPSASPLFVELKPFTATLNDAGLAQILYLEITLRIASEADREYLTEYMPEVRSRVLAELSRHTAHQLQLPEGRAALAEALRKVIAAPYPPEVKALNVTQVLFTAFVVQ